MKLSNYSLNYASGGRPADVFAFLATCRELGMEGASLHIRDLPGTTPEILARIRRALLDQGLSLGMLTVSTDFGRAGDRVDEVLARAREAIDASVVLGAPILRVFAGSPAVW